MCEFRNYAAAQEMLSQLVDFDSSLHCYNVVCQHFSHPSSSLFDFLPQYLLQTVACKCMNIIYTFLHFVCQCPNHCHLVLHCIEKPLPLDTDQRYLERQLAQAALQHLTHLTSVGHYPIPSYMCHFVVQRAAIVFLPLAV